MKDDRRTRVRTTEQALRDLIQAELAHERAAADEQRAAELADRVAAARDRYQRLTRVA